MVSYKIILHRYANQYDEPAQTKIDNKAIKAL